jgi:RNA polymerase sigma-70 factor (ECF subfamily)
VSDSSQTDSQTELEELYRATRKDVLAYLARRAGDPEEAADMLAETYLIACRRLHAIPAGNEARLWLFGVARNLLLKSRERRQSDDALVEQLAFELHMIRNEPPVVDDHRADALRASLEALPAKEREILMLTAWEGLTPREIATVIGSSPNLVRVRLHHARAQLRRELRSIAGPATRPNTTTMKTDPPHPATRSPT